MDFFNIHTHMAEHPESEILSVDVHSYSSIDKNAFLSVGIHPWFLTDDDAENQLDLLRKFIESKEVVAIGECGLDKLKGPSMELQKVVFKEQMAMAEVHGLPLVIHCVKASNELIQLKRQTRPEQPWIIHGFRGKEALAKEYIQHGFYLSFGACYQEEALRSVPVERLFIETDESELSIEDIYLRVAQSRGMDLKELTESIKKNVERVIFKH